MSSNSPNRPERFQRHAGLRRSRKRPRPPSTVRTWGFPGDDSAQGQLFQEPKPAEYKKLQAKNNKTAKKTPEKAQKKAQKEAQEQRPKKTRERPPAEDPKAKKDQDRKPVTVSEAAAQVRQVVESHFQPMWILGEVSNARRPRSGHLYFTLKDQRALLNAVMFRGAIETGLPVPLQDGMEVLVHGRLSTYERASEVQVIVDRAEPHGTGALELRREQLRRQFAREGLFSAKRKKPLPRYPRRVGIVTSPTGAAIRDILTTLDRRWPRLHVIIAPVRVQGQGAAEQMAEAIIRLNELEPRPELIILARGGGSVEHLWCFNEEPLIYAMAQSRLPIVSGVGHEIDETLCDFVADCRMPTPTAAAEAIVPELGDLLEALNEVQRRMNRALQARLKRARQSLTELERRPAFQTIQRRIARSREELEDSQRRFDQALKRQLRRQQEQLQRLAQSYGFRALPERLKRHREELGQLRQRLYEAMRQRLKGAARELSGLPQERLEAAFERTHEQRREQLAQAAAQLDALSPLKVLARGYSLTRKGKSVVRRPEDVKPGDIVSIKLAKGEIQAQIVERQSQERESDETKDQRP